MEFFKPTWKKLLIAAILTFWPYVASVIFIMLTKHRDSISDPMVQASFWCHTYYWSPLYPLVQLIPNSQSNQFWQSNTFYFFVYPLLRFSIRYVVACAIIFFANKLVNKNSKIKQKASPSVSKRNS